MTAKRVFRKIHLWLSVPFGIFITLICFSGSMLVVILVTGILMWLTNRHKPLARSLTISVIKGWPRFWHDLHVAGGIYVTLFLLALALTGLTWSFSWYRSGFYSLFGVEIQAEAERTAVSHHGSGQQGHARSSGGQRKKKHHCHPDVEGDR